MIPDPTKVFAYNRYMYAYGNPLKYTDLSGNAPKSAAPIPGFSRDVFPNWYIAATCFFAQSCSEVDGTVYAIPDPFAIEASIGLGSAKLVAKGVGNAVTESGSDYLAPEAFEEMMNLGARSWTEFDSIVRSVPSDTIVRGMIDRAGNHVTLRTGSRISGLRHIVGCHLTGDITGSYTSFFPETAKVKDISTAIADVVANGVRTIESETGRSVYTSSNKAFREMKVIVNEFGNVVTAFPIE